MANIFEHYGEGFELILISEKLKESLRFDDAPRNVETAPVIRVRKKVKITTDISESTT